MSRPTWRPPRGSGTRLMMAATAASQSATAAHGQPAPGANRDGRHWSRLTEGEPRWLVRVVLALPFLVMIAALRGMTVALPIFHGSDERVYHYPTILRFSHELPFPDLHSYPAAQTPLFHLLMAYAGKAVGYELWRLRLLQVLISYLLALAVYALLHRRLRVGGTLALVLTLLFVISPYVFGQSFRLGTDNLALLFSVLAIERFERFRECDRLGPFLAGCLFVALAMLTRQSTAFLPAVAALYALRPAAKLAARDRVIALLAVGASCVPVGLLFLNWHGLVPVGGDPSSCGLCVAKGTGTGLSTGGLEVQTMELALATLGLYGIILFAPALPSRLRADVLARHDRTALAKAARWPLVAAFGGVVLLLVFPATPGPQAAGDVWKVAAHLPAIDRTSLLFWVLVPLAGAVLWIRLRGAPDPWLIASLAACFLISAVAIKYPWQKYVDPFVLLLLLVTVGPSDLDKRWKLAGVAVLAALFLAYAADYSSHESTPRPTTAAAPAQKSRLAVADDWGRRRLRDQSRHAPAPERIAALEVAAADGESPAPVGPGEDVSPVAGRRFTRA